MIIHDLEQGSDEWHQLRCGLPTASEGSKLITSTGAPSKSLQGYAESLAGDMYAGHPLNLFEGNKYTQFGNDMEEEARLSYTLESGNDVKQCGFITDSNKCYGASPDGLIGDIGLVEIKNLPKKHISALLYWKKHNKTPPDYKVQCQFQLMVTNREWCDLYYYSRDLPCLTIRQYPDKKMIEALHGQLTMCLKERGRILTILESY